MEPGVTVLRWHPGFKGKAMEDAVDQRNAILAGGHPGMHPSVRRVFVKLPVSK